MIDESGINAFSLRRLAGVLGVRVSALYNHIENESDLLIEVAQRSADMYKEYIGNIMEGIPLEEATYKAGDAFRDFLLKHKYLYDLLLDRRWIGNRKFDKVTESFTQPIFDLLYQHGVEDKIEKEHLYVVMRVVTHGFASLDSLGVFDGLCADRSESYHRMIAGVIEMMKQSAGKTGEKNESKTIE